MADLNGSGNTDQEFLLMALQIDATANMMEDPNVFIRDTGYLSDATLSSLGF